ncbi:hypothetical protein QTL97_09435 [Sporosarcina thermotolerans]|uniref:Uncharacterized protein n=1 Tax=Sporosarcina thermotolerans TaxID=633404 RepID=A0AAW9A952_9BACL|nr:hypothetical protein [Sporosarcina thermotolerans]MDW0117158.1 hypothetical protein [Sporosarcina thermotolerans]WHT47765.1 hypothetical protein QNH10_16865 [Sporosarcina thermotolerans]
MISAPGGQSTNLREVVSSLWEVRIGLREVCCILWEVRVGLWEVGAGLWKVALTLREVIEFRIASEPGTIHYFKTDDKLSKDLGKSMVK